MIKSIDLLMRFVQKFYDVLLDVYDFMVFLMAPMYYRHSISHRMTISRLRSSCRKALLIRKLNKNRKAIHAMARMQYKLIVRQNILETECDVISAELKKK